MFGIIIIVGVLAFTLNQNNAEPKLADRMVAGTTGQQNQNRVIQGEEWNSSGIFAIDKQKYMLNEKVFINIEGLGFKEKGTMAFMRPLNDTHYMKYLSIEFDGSKKSDVKQYFTPRLNELDKICTVDQIIGEWMVMIYGTENLNETITFELTDEILGEKEGLVGVPKFDPVC